MNVKIGAASIDGIIGRTSSSFKGILFLIAGVLSFSIQDPLIKLMSADYPVHEIVLIRSLVAIGPILLIAHFAGGIKYLRTGNVFAHLVRAGVMFTSYTCYFLALAALPLTDTVTIFFSAPLFITILSVYWLDEKVEFGFWIAVCTGFIGVVIMLKPGADVFKPAAVLALIAALSYAVAAIMTRKLGKTENGASMAFYPTIVYIFLSATIGLVLSNSAIRESEHPSLQFLFNEWISPSALDLCLISALGIMAALGFYFLSQAYRLAQPALAAPFEYIAVPLGILWSYVFWKDVPKIQSILAMVLIVGSGIYIFSRESFPDRNRILSVFKIKVRR
jgi:drug/metabolite transporter (DMT)-like permease